MSRVTTLCAGEPRVEDFSVNGPFRQLCGSSRMTNVTPGALPWFAHCVSPAMPLHVATTPFLPRCCEGEFLALSVLFAGVRLDPFMAGADRSGGQVEDPPGPCSRRTDFSGCRMASRSGRLRCGNAADALRVRAWRVGGAPLAARLSGKTRTPLCVKQYDEHSGVRAWGDPVACGAHFWGWVRELARR